MATFEVGEVLIATEGLLRPYKAKITEWEKDKKDKNKYDPPSDEELFLKLVDPEKLEPPKNPVYNDQLKRSMEICYTKFYREQYKLLVEMEQVINGYQVRPGMVEWAKEDGNLLPSYLEKEKLEKRLEGLLSSMASLYHREKGYLEQNRIYRQKIFDLICNLQKSWIHLYRCTTTWHKKGAEKYKIDNDEITSLVEVIKILEN